MYPPPPGSAPGYQNAHHCTKMKTRNVSPGTVHIGRLEELAHDLWWSWNAEAREVFRDRKD